MTQTLLNIIIKHDPLNIKWLYIKYLISWGSFLGNVIKLKYIKTIFKGPVLSSVINLVWNLNTQNKLQGAILDHVMIFSMKLKYININFKEAILHHVMKFTIKLKYFKGPFLGQVIKFSVKIKVLNTYYSLLIFCRKLRLTGYEHKDDCEYSSSQY